ncbi:ABC transporter permease [Embleya hyalina]|uniref:Peptide ABC transporter permease n=1 Tax=Embleya hyalina TaxID=516124 RepID=A0A401Z1D4_9ACTN|nr:ABC transporter permease [Embleya hyalina]GCE00649.1 peptide ABC transporter permease [Embleya hyalina]
MSAIVPQLGDLGKSTRRRSKRLPWTVLVCLVIVAGVVLMTVFGAALAPQDPAAQHLTEVLAPPGSGHWLGTDELGRDVFSRLIAGARTAFVGPLVVTIGSMLIGNLLGLWSGYKGGAVDAIVMRWVDFMWALPGLLIIVVVAGAFGGGYWMAVALLLVLTIPFDTRIIRGATLEQATLPYVEAARALGLSNRRIMLLHIWPNLSATAVANAFLTFAGAIVALSGLSFLGFGVDPGSPDWGRMLSDGTNLLFENPAAALASGAMIVATAVSMNIIGDWLYESLSSRGGSK